MKRSLPLILETIHSVAIALWLGGSACAILLALSGGAPALYQGKSDAVIELAGFLCVGIQFLTRKRYQANRMLFVGDGVRHLLTFAALVVMEAVKLNLHAASRASLTARVSPVEIPALALEIVLLIAVSAFTIWLPSPQALAFAASLNRVAQANPGKGKTSK